MEDGDGGEDESMQEEAEEGRRPMFRKSENQPSSQEVQEHVKLTSLIAHGALIASEEGQCCSMDCEACGLVGSQTATLKCDNEPAILALAQEIRRQHHHHRASREGREAEQPSC